MQNIVDELLENALANGYDQSEAPPMDVAMDMVRCSADVEMENPEDLIPYIENWQARQKAKK